MQDNSPDLRHLIRSVQRLEGNPDCFRKAKGHCDNQECTWRIYCLEESQNHLLEEKDVSDRFTR